MKTENSHSFHIEMKTARPSRKENKQTKKKKKRNQNNDNNNTNLKAHVNKQANNNTKKQNKTNKQTKQIIIIIIKLKLNKIIQLLTVLQELVTLDGSLAHVIQAPNTQPYHS